MHDLKEANASAPGSLMLLGEHAVLRGYPAIILSLPELIHVEITPCKNSQDSQKSKIFLHSTLGTLSFFPEKIHELISSIQEKNQAKNFEYLLKTLEYAFTLYSSPDFVSPLVGETDRQATSPLGREGEVSRAPPPSWFNGFSLTVTSDFKSSVGLGSSTAVVVAALNALSQSFHCPLSPQDLFSHSLKIIRDIQGEASGADVAASVYGGCLFYHAEKSESLPYLPQIDWKFSGKKVPTKEVIAQVNLLDSDYRDPIFEKIGIIVIAAREALLNKDTPGFAQSLIQNQKLMEALFLDTPALKKTRQELAQDPDVLATKISGAGLGDGVIGFKGFY